MIRIAPETVEAARGGSRAALEDLVRSVRRPVYNLALRMLADRDDADDAAQEIVVKIITKLGGLRDPAAAAGWALRVAMRHLVLERRKGRLEAARMTFRGFGEDLADGLDAAAATDEAAPDAEHRVLIAQVKIGCTLALLTCLTRPLRAAYVLGEIYELSDAEAASVLEIAPSAFRQRLKRARALVLGHARRRCGVVSPEAPCRCAGRVARAEALGRLARGPQPPEIAEHDVAAATEAVRRLEATRRSAALLRSNPDFAADHIQIRRLLDLALAD